MEVVVEGIPEDIRRPRSGDRHTAVAPLDHRHYCHFSRSFVVRRQPGSNNSRTRDDGDDGARPELTPVIPVSVGKTAATVAGTAVGVHNNVTVAAITGLAERTI